MGNIKTFEFDPESGLWEETVLDGYSTEEEIKFMEAISCIKLTSVTE